MYIAGIHFSNEQLTEGIVATSLLLAGTASEYKARKTIKYANEHGGPVKSLPTTFLGRFITPIHHTARIVPPVTYFASVLLGGGMQHPLIKRFVLPNFGMRDDLVDAVRVLGAFTGLFVVRPFFNAIHDELGQSFHYIGVREKPKIATTGPFAIVRHPLYGSILLQQLALSVAWWNYIPAVATGIIAIAFIIKIPIEEKLIESDPMVGPKYAEYMKKVPYRLIPKVW